MYQLISVILVFLVNLVGGMYQLSCKSLDVISDEGKVSRKRSRGVASLNFGNKNTVRQRKSYEEGGFLATNQGAIPYAGVISSHHHVLLQYF